MAVVDNFQAYVSAGRWVVDCPQCNSALDAKAFGAERRRAVFGCIECGCGFDQTVWRETITRIAMPVRVFALGDLREAMQAPILWPDEVEAIELALLRRGYMVWQNWRPGMTVQELIEAEPFLHFSWTAPMTYSAGAVLTAGQQNTYVRDNSNETSPAKAAAQGDTFYATAANAIARLAKGTAYQYLRMNTGVTAPEWSGATPALDVVTAETAISPTAETTIYTYSLAGGVLSTNNVLVLTLAYKHAVATQTFTIKGKYGGTTMATLAASASDMGASGAGIILFILKGDGASNAQEATLSLLGNAASSPSVSGTAAIDSTVSQTLLVSGAIGGGAGTFTTLASRLEEFDNL